jgi:hypothetical protein
MRRAGSISGVPFREVLRTPTTSAPSRCPTCGTPLHFLSPPTSAILYDVTQTKTSTQILLFVSRNSLYFQTTMEEFKHLLTLLQELQPFTHEVIDVSESPERAEKYKIDALPTLIIGSKRFIGQAKADEIVKMLREESDT